MKQRFKATMYWNKYKSEIKTQLRNNNFFFFFFIIITLVKIKDFKALIGDKTCSDQSVKN